MFQSLDNTPIVREGFVRGPMTYAGSKYDSLKFIMDKIPYRKVFVDVFGGGGTVTLNRKPSKLDVFNDRHSGITAFYKCIQNREKLDRLIEILEHLPHSREMHSTFMKEWGDEEDDVMRAAKFYYVVQVSFGGLCRTYGRAVDPKSASQVQKARSNIKHFDYIHQRFKDVQIENLDWRMMFKDYDSADTVFYLDPPYVGCNIYDFRMSNAEHEEMCHRAFECEGFVALSGYENKIYDKFKWDEIYEFDLFNKVAAQAFQETNNMVGKELTHGRGNRKEVLWIKH